MKGHEIRGRTDPEPEQTPEFYLMPHMMSNPVLTVGIPTYNSGKYIADCISSVLNQSYQDYEILVVDNDSVDDTLTIVGSFNDKRIRILKNEVNEGPHYSIHRIHSEARGRLIRCVCSDDVLLPGALEDQVRLFDRIPQLALASCDFLVTDEHLKVDRCVRCLSGVLTLDEVKRGCLSDLRNRVGGPSNFMYPAESAKQITLHRHIRYLGDLEYALQLLKFGLYASTGVPNVLYRRHDDTDTGRVWSPENETGDWLKIMSLHGGLDHLIAIRFLFRPKSVSDRKFLRTWWRKNGLSLGKLAVGTIQFVVLQIRKLTIP